MRDGWSDAEARAQGTEDMFKESEAEVLCIVIYIVNTFAGLNLKASGVEPRFTRRNYENVQSKAQVLVQMLQQNKIHPCLAFQHSGLFTDPESAYLLSKEYFEEQEKKALEMKEKQGGDDPDASQGGTHEEGNDNKNKAHGE
jgi:hypothetical protein